MSEASKLHYTFEDIVACEMCGDPTSRHRLLGQRLNCSQGFNPRSKTGIAVSVKKCSSCGLIYASPQPIPRNIGDHYGTPPESYWVPEYFQLSDQYFAAEIQTAKELLPFGKGMTALDVGAGIGKCMIALSAAGFDVYGFEPSTDFYERAITRMGVSPERLKQGMIETLDYPAESFDFITFGAVLEHLYHPAASIEKAMRWLKPSGLIHAEVPSSRHLLPKFLNAYFRLLGTTYVTHLSPMHTPFHLYEFGLASFEKLGQRLGFGIARSEVRVCSIKPFPSVLHPLLRYIMKNTDTGMQLTVWLRKKSGAGGALRHPLI